MTCAIHVITRNFLSVLIRQDVRLSMELDDGAFGKNGGSHAHVSQTRLDRLLIYLTMPPPSEVSRDRLSRHLSCVVSRLRRCCPSLMGDCAIQDSLLRLDIVTRSEWRDSAHLASRCSRKYRERRRKSVHAWPCDPGCVFLILRPAQISRCCCIFGFFSGPKSFLRRRHPCCILP